MKTNCERCHSTGIVEGDQGPELCLSCNSIHVMDGHQIVHFTLYGVAQLKRIWAKECLVLLLFIGGRQFDAVRVGWN